MGPSQLHISQNETFNIAANASAQIMKDLPWDVMKATCRARRLLSRGWQRDEHTQQHPKPRQTAATEIFRRSWKLFGHNWSTVGQLFWLRFIGWEKPAAPLIKIDHRRRSGGLEAVLRARALQRAASPACVRLQDHRRHDDDGVVLPAGGIL
jgi:hypothetical protein